jgi:hypothetical protein
MSPSKNGKKKQNPDVSVVSAEEQETEEQESKRKLIHPYLSKELHQKVRLYCTIAGISTSKFAEAAFAEFLSDAADSASILKKLDRYYHKMEVIDSNVQILSEAFGLFLQYWFAHTPSIQEEDKKMASHNGKQRYEAFVEYLHKNMISGRRFADEFVVPVADEEELRRAAEEGYKPYEKQ